MLHLVIKSLEKYCTLKVSLMVLSILYAEISFINAQPYTVDTSSYSKYIIEFNKAIKAGNTDNAIRHLLKAADILERANNKQKLADVYVQIADIYEKTGAGENAIDYYEKALGITDFNNIKQRSVIKEKLGTTYLKLQKADKALENLKFAANIYEETKQLDNLLKISEKTTNAYRLKGDYQNSLNLGNKMIELSRNMKNTNSEYYWLNSIGYDQFRMGSFREANTTFQKAYQNGLVNKTSSKNLINILINQGVCLYNSSIPTNAIAALKTAADINKTNTDFYLQAKIENLIASIYLNTNDLYNAGVFSRNSIFSARKSLNLYMLQECYNTYSQVLKAGNDHIRALEYYEKYLSLRDSLLLEERLADQEKSRNKFNLEKSEKEFRLKIADENIWEMNLRQLQMEQQRLQQLQQKRIDSLEQARVVANLEFEKQRQKDAFDLERLRRERADQDNQSLRQKNIIQEQKIELKRKEEIQQRAEISRLETEKKQEQKIKRAAIVIVILLIFTAIIILSGLFVTRKKNTLLARQKKEIEEKNEHLEQLNEEITTQKEIIEDKNKAITDSIRYAERIQSAVLPPQDFFKENLQEYFILFKPRDIVSGDFYWGAKKNNKLIITAADCTGHGVPGAFMSMLGTAFLNEIVNEFDVIRSDEILNQLRKNVISALRQTGEAGEASDGMDIALCIIDYKNNILQYSGAFNPMYYISENTLTEIVPDRMPIGIHFNSDNKFKKHDINFKNGDLFYIFSDGYADQFGGPKGKKLYYEPFKNLLFENHNKSMSEQKQILETAFNEWKGSFDQIDDVLIIGVRL